MKRIAILIGALALAGCQTDGVGSVAGGDCKLVATPVYAVKGKTAYDQEWVDDTTEAIVTGCKQARPKKRPASLDMPVKAPPVVSASQAAMPVIPPPKVHWWQKIIHKKP